MITIEDFQKIEMRIGTVRTAESMPGSEKLLKLEVDFGSETRQIIAGVARAYTPEALLGRQFVFVTNLEPRKLMGLESQGMILATAGADGNPVLLCPEKEVAAGSRIH